MSLKDICTTWAPRVLSLLRFMAGLLILQYGMAKILGFPALDRFAKLQSFSLPWFAGVLELIGGALLVIGLFTRQVAFVLSGLMAFAYFIAHAPRAFYPIANGGDLAVIFCFVFFYLAFAGGGSWSADALRKSA